MKRSLAVAAATLLACASQQKTPSATPAGASTMEDRASVIKYLMSQTDNPPPVPASDPAIAPVAAAPANAAAPAAAPAPPAEAPAKK